MWHSNTTIDYPEPPRPKLGQVNVQGSSMLPDINAKKNISSPTIPPMTSPPYPLNPLVKTTTAITAINNADVNTSNISYFIGDLTTMYHEQTQSVIIVLRRHNLF